ncbi:MAG: cytidylyltransferase domain-containing protein, partial [Hyphomicrobiaceae bacterium]
MAACPLPVASPIAPLLDPNAVDTGEVVAVIPARGGSKGIPRKNLLPLRGHPLLAWSIWAAREARRVTRVIVSTDDEEIAGAARLYGADVVMRP